jgi:3-oxoacid CoA-transferase subunit B
MMHVNKAGQSKILKKCSLHDDWCWLREKVVTELAVLEVTPKGFKLLEHAPSDCRTIVASTEAELILKELFSNGD